MKLDEIISDGLAFLKKTQRTDGGFMGYSSASPHDFRQAHRHPTVFISALISVCIRDIEELSIRKNISKFLLDNKDNDWTWNYWAKKDRNKLRKYPNDLDDTFYSLCALVLESPKNISDRELGVITKRVIDTEVRPGGPYGTWYVGPEEDSTWRDVDIAVNANVGYFFSLLGVNLPGLTEFIDNKIMKRDLKSRYYCEEISVIYFLSRWYRGKGVGVLKAVIEAHIQKCDKSRPLEISMVLSSAVDLGVNRSRLKPLSDCLVNLRQHAGFWRAEGLYFEPEINNVQQYAGSESLTTAFCLESLSKFMLLSSKSFAISEQGVQESDNNQRVEASPETIDSSLDRWRERVNNFEKSSQISKMASLTSESLGVDINSALIDSLNEGSIYGWTAYTIYDDILDGDCDTIYVSVANEALRRSVESFYKAGSVSPKFMKEVKESFYKIDQANFWEKKYAHKSLSDIGTLADLPEYGDLTQLSNKSLGHMLASIGVLYIAEVPQAQINSLKNFFKHYLIARQLTDDAHDWESDFLAGRATLVVTTLLNKYPNPLTIDSALSLDPLRIFFWENIIEDISALITSNLKAATKSLLEVDLVDSKVFHSWIEDINKSAKEAISEKNKAMSFIEGFTE